MAIARARLSLGGVTGVEIPLRHGQAPAKQVEPLAAVGEVVHVGGQADGQLVVVQGGVEPGRVQVVDQLGEGTDRGGLLPGPEPGILGRQPVGGVPAVPGAQRVGRVGQLEAFGRVGPQRFEQRESGAAAVDQRLFDQPRE